MPSDHIEPTITRDSSHDKPPEEEPEEVEVKDTPPLFVPQRPNFEIIRFPTNRGSLEWWHIFIAVLAALFIFWLFRHWYKQYEIEKAISEMPAIFQNALRGLPQETVKSIPLVKSSAPVLVGPYQLPLSPKYRIAGKTGTPGHSFYMATGGVGAYVMIPVQDCMVWLHIPYCKYRGYTVTTVSGTKSDTP